MTGLGSSCGACKFLRRKCTSECVFTPYFCYNQAADDFAAVHKVFGASNVSKLLLNLPVHKRNEAAISISYEALERIRDPIHGCVAQIVALQQQVASLQEEIDLLGNQMANTAFDVPTYGSSQAINNNPNNGLQFSFQCSNDISIGDYLNQQIPSIGDYLNQHTPPPVSQAFCSQTSELPPSLHNWEDQVSHSYSDLTDKLFEGTDQVSYSYSDLTERLFEGMDQQFFCTDGQWM